jgi:hypothetical protein
MRTTIKLVREQHKLPEMPGMLMVKNRKKNRGETGENRAETGHRRRKTGIRQTRRGRAEPGFYKPGKKPGLAGDHPGKVGWTRGKNDHGKNANFPQPLTIQLPPPAGSKRASDANNLAYLRF